MPFAKKPTVLHYTGYTLDGGGILAVVRALAEEGLFQCILGVSPAYTQLRRLRLHLWRGPPVDGEHIDLRNALHTLGVAWRVRRWLRRGGHRVFHGHSRAGLLVGLWLMLLGERRAVVTVHCYGRQRWVYRRIKDLLGDRLFWLGPAMKAYYRIGSDDWSGCLPDCVPLSAVRPMAGRPKRFPVTFGCVGGLEPVKCWELVLRALGRVSSAVSLRVVHAGSEGGSVASADYAAGLRRLSRELGVADRMEWRGKIDDLAAFYAEMDCLVVASRLEASSVAALEAIGAGVPVLAPADSGTTDLIRCCCAGWVYATDSVEALAVRLTELATGPELATWRRNDAGLAAFTSAQVARKHAAAYQALLQ